MARRVELDEALAPLAMPGRIYNELCAHALETLPEECCGLIVGGASERFRQVRRCRNDMTARHQRDPVAFPRDGRRAFYMNEFDYMRVQKQAEERGERVTAVYHSHVGAGVYLSEMDLEYAESAFFPFPDADQVVLAVSERKVRGLGLFRRDADVEGFAGRRIVPEGA